jgi:hypothetical protein
VAISSVMVEIASTQYGKTPALGLAMTEIFRCCQICFY